jgi:hypothetical protein
MCCNAADAAKRGRRLHSTLLHIFILRLSVSMDHNGVAVRVCWVRGWAVGRGLDNPPVVGPVGRSREAPDIRTPLSEGLFIHTIPY